MLSLQSSNYNNMSFVCKGVALPRIDDVIPSHGTTRGGSKAIFNSDSQSVCEFKPFVSVFCLLGRIARQFVCRFARRSCAIWVNNICVCCTRGRTNLSIRFCSNNLVTSWWAERTFDRPARCSFKRHLILVIYLNRMNDRFLILSIWIAGSVGNFWQIFRVSFFRR